MAKFWHFSGLVMSGAIGSTLLGWLMLIHPLFTAPVGTIYGFSSIVLVACIFGPDWAIQALTRWLDIDEQSFYLAVCTAAIALLFGLGVSAICVFL